MKLSKCLLTLGCSSMLALQASPALSCSPIMVANIQSEEDTRAAEAHEIERLRQCVIAHAQKDDFLSAVQRGEHDLAEVRGFVSIITGGGSGCLNDRAMAFRVFEAQFGDPLPRTISNVDLRKLHNLLSGNEGLTSPDQVRRIVARNWLVDTYDYSSDLRTMNAEEFEELLLVPENWEVARQNLGGNRLSLSYPLRLNLMFRHASDPQSPYYDVALASGLAFRTGYLGDDLRVANLYLQEEVSEYELYIADGLLDWYSPFHLRTDVQTHEVAREHFAYLGYLMLQSGEVGLQERGAEILASLDPVSAGELQVPNRVSLVEAGNWESVFPESNITDPGVISRIGGNYPASALMRDQTGVTESSLLFGPDGDFEQVWINRSSGSDILDNATVRGFERYLRPRLAGLTLPEQYIGQPSLVTMPPIVWRIGIHGADSEFRDGMFYVTASMRSSDGCF